MVSLSIYTINKMNKADCTMARSRKVTVPDFRGEEVSNDLEEVAYWEQTILERSGLVPAMSLCSW